VYSETEVVQDVEKLKHNRIREVLKHFAIKERIEICSFSDVSTKGTGLGSSSSFTVGLINAFASLYSKRDLAELACQIEIEKCAEPIGKQDQYAAAYGGFNVIRFDSSGVDVHPVDVSGLRLLELNENLMCYSTGITRNTSDILSDQTKNVAGDDAAFDTTTKMVELAEQALSYLRLGKLDDFGALLDDGWNYKKQLSNKISNPEIDEMYERAKNAGALGGKILGAGGGGYMLLYVPSIVQGRVYDAMKGYKKRFSFRFTEQGSVATQIR
jgi:D-glycero-alpha-D-manno-heptose-7-phosphate kinase